MDRLKFPNITSLIEQFAFNSVIITKKLLFFRKVFDAERQTLRVMGAHNQGFRRPDGGIEMSGHSNVELKRCEPAEMVAPSKAISGGMGLM
jgi:hypothetical protein